MGQCYEKLLKPLLFRYEPEKVHDAAVKTLRLLSKSHLLCQTLAFFNQRSATKPIELFDLKFCNAVGLAAGMDKNGEFWPAASALGFGHVEIGTITHQKQPGNPKPRLFRYPPQNAIINRMGFNNDGAEAVAKRLKKTLSKKNKGIILGINIGKSRAVCLEEAAADYLESFNLLADYADYFTINVSSPNTPNLRKLQQEERLRTLMQVLQQANETRAKKRRLRAIPLLVKIAPDLTFRQIDTIIELIFQLNYSGIIATNTTLKRSNFLENINEDGGLSGEPLHPYSLQIINYIHRSTLGKLPIIGTGGIMDPRTAGETMDAGASLVQVYTGMIYKGPLFAKEIAKALSY
jgi:dihydroorotate dehydrogenase